MTAHRHRSTQPSAGGDRDPRWPGPPSPWPGGQAPGGPPPGWGAPTPAGPPPPPWRRRRRAWLLGIGITAGVLALMVPATIGVVGFARSFDDISLTEGDGPTGGPSDDAAPAPPGDVEVEVPDLDGLEGRDAAVAGMLVDIDRAERTMIGTQEQFGEILADPSVEGDLQVAIDELSAAAADGQQELEDIRRDLTAPNEGGGAREVRDRYLAHLDSWIRYFVALEQDPTLLAGGGDDETYRLAIDSTGYAFAREVRENLPDDLDDDVRAFALAIVERGFPDRELDPRDTV